jgi:hypothetical protein
MTHRTVRLAPLVLLAALVATPAIATDVSLGVAVGASVDLPDKAAADHTRFGPGPTLSIPLRVELAPHAFFTATLRADLGTGRDRVSWAQQAGDQPVRVASTDHWAMLTAGALTVGVEGRVPLGDSPVRPLGGLGIGGAWVSTWHSFGLADSGVDTTFLIDPAQNDLSDPGNIDPYASNLALLVDVRLGCAYGVTDTLEVVGEIGYSTAFLPSTPLQKATPGLDARRDAFAWNTLRLQAGASFTF